jgi:hypothetical protein
MANPMTFFHPNRISVVSRPPDVVNCAPLQKRLQNRFQPGFWARSSAVEHCVDIAGVTGSIPVVPTIYIQRKPERFRLFLCQHLGFYFGRKLRKLRKFRKLKIIFVVVPTAALSSERSLTSL